MGNTQGRYRMEIPPDINLKTMRRRKNFIVNNKSVKMYLIHSSNIIRNTLYTTKLLHSRANNSFNGYFEVTKPHTDFIIQNVQHHHINHNLFDKYLREVLGYVSAVFQNASAVY